MRLIAFHQTAFEDYSDWAKADKKLFERIRRIIFETARTPFEGIGKPEPLKHELKGYFAPADRRTPSRLQGNRRTNHHHLLQISL